MEEETQFMRNLLPDHYTCESREKGVHCYSFTGIDENDSEQWDYIVKAVKQKLGERFMEIDHQVCTNHSAFTVYIHSK